MTVRRHFITFEGGEGAGKSTQVKILADRLAALGHSVVVTREPGGSPFAEAIRSLLLSGSVPPHAPLAEALLFYSARADHVAHTIRPALERGAWVLCDRYSDSTRVYQGIAGDVPTETLAVLERVVVGDMNPALTLMLDLPAAEGLARAVARRSPDAAVDPFESRTLAFHERLRDGFRAIAAAEPARCVLVDARPGPAAVAAAIWNAVEARLLKASV